MPDPVKLRQNEAARTFVKAVHLISLLDPQARARFPEFFDYLRDSLWDALRASLNEMDPLLLDRVVANAEAELARREVLRAREGACTG